MGKKYPISFNSGYVPLNYDQISNIDGRINPSMMKYCNSFTFAYWQRSLYQRVISVFDFENLPAKWEGSVRDFFYWCIFSIGHVGVFENTKFGGIVFQPGCFKGKDFYYQPTNYIVTNPALKGSLDLKIHEDVEIIKLCPDYRGTWDTITYYAMLLSMLDAGISMSIINNKFAFVLGAKNKAMAETLKKITDKINAGEPTIIYDSEMPNDPTSKEEPFQFLERNNLKQSYLTTDQLMDRQTLISAFDSEIGIVTLPYNKRERLITAEASGKEDDAMARANVWLETLDSSLKLVNDRFGTNISVKFSSEEVNNYGDVIGNGESDRDRKITPV